MTIWVVLQVTGLVRGPAPGFDQEVTDMRFKYRQFEFAHQEAMVREDRTEGYTYSRVQWRIVMDGE